MRLIYDRIKSRVSLEAHLCPHYERMHKPSPADGPELMRVRVVISAWVESIPEVFVKAEHYGDVPVNSSDKLNYLLDNDATYREVRECLKVELCEELQKKFDRFLPFTK